jgi:hypothetical protein
MSCSVRGVRIDRLVLRNVDLDGGSAGLERLIAEALADHAPERTSERLVLPAGTVDRAVARRVAGEIRARTDLR